MSAKRERFVCVEWDDAAHNSGYYDATEPERFTPISSQTVGHLIQKNRKQVIVAQERYFGTSSSVEYRYTQIIPRKMVTKIRYLEDGK